MRRGVIQKGSRRFVELIVRLLKMIHFGHRKE